MRKPWQSNSSMPKLPSEDKADKKPADSPGRRWRVIFDFAHARLPRL